MVELEKVDSLHEPLTRFGLANDPRAL